MTLVTSAKEAGILNVQLNRPEKLNACNTALLQSLQTVLAAHASDDQIKILMLSGCGGCFAAGADIKELSEMDDAGIRRFHRLREKTLALLEAFPAPTMAVIQRYALGTGLELALSCDFRIAGAEAQFGIPSARLGIVESYEYTTRLVRAVGAAQAKKMVFTGERLNAETAFAVGIIQEVVPAEMLLHRGQALADAVCANSGIAMRRSKAVIDTCRRDPNLEQVADTAQPMADALQTADFKEGTRAFLEKRRPRFTGC